jgi:Dockerin type I domain
MWTSTSIQYVTITAETIQADINRDGIVDILDATRLAKAFNSKPAYPNFDHYADINEDDIVDLFDAILLTDHYGQLYP